MFNIFRKKTLVHLVDFETLYNMEIQSQLSVPQEKEPLQLQSKMQVYISQRVEKYKIINSISSLLLENKASTLDFQSFINEVAIVSKILKKIEIKRGLNGEIKELINKKQILQFWDNWRKDELYHFFPKLGEQEKFVQMMDRGLSNLDTKIKNELQYLLLLPECYSFNNYIGTVDKNYTNLYTYTPKFIQDLDIEYSLTPVKIDESENELSIKLESCWINENEMRKALLDDQAYHWGDLSFHLILEYCFEKETGKILNSQLKLKEFINQNIHYSVTANVYEKLDNSNKL